METNHELDAFFNRGQWEYAPREAYPLKEKPSALSVQVGGEHYKKYAIQPVEYCQRNKLGFCESSVVKYISRWREKGGLADLEKAKHFIDMLIEMET